MNRVDQVVSWVIVGVFVLGAGGGFGFWWLRNNVIAPSCGDIAVGQLNAAMSELSDRIPGLRFADTGDDCDSGGAVYASWEHDDLEQLLATAQAAGCRLNEMGVNQEERGSSDVRHFWQGGGALPWRAQYVPSDELPGFGLDVDELGLTRNHGTPTARSDHVRVSASDIARKLHDGESS